MVGNIGLIKQQWKKSDGINITTNRIQVLIGYKYSKSINKCYIPQWCNIIEINALVIILIEIVKIIKAKLSYSFLKNKEYLTRKK